jgi:tryptophanyl-tRNA synthetase
VEEELKGKEEQVEDLVSAFKI